MKEQLCIELVISPIHKVQSRTINPLMMKGWYKLALTSYYTELSGLLEYSQIYLEGHRMDSDQLRIVFSSDFLFFVFFPIHTAPLAS